MLGKNCEFGRALAQQTLKTCANLRRMKVLGGVLIITRHLTTAERKQIATLRKQFRISRIRPSAYVIRERWNTLTPKQQLHTRIAAEALCQPELTVIGRSAAALLGLATPTHHPTTLPIELGSESSTCRLRPPPRPIKDQLRAETPLPVRTRKLPASHRARSLLMRTEFGDVRVSSLADMCAELALWCPLNEAVVGIESALRHQDISMREVAELLRDRHGKPAAEKALSLVTSFSESPRESELKIRMWEAGLPAPYQQVEIINDLGMVLGRVDFMFACGLIVEYDGADKYLLNGNSRKSMTTEQVLYAERVREKLLQNEGFVVFRVDANSFRSDLFLLQIQEILERLRASPLGISPSRWRAGGLAWSND